MSIGAAALSAYLSLCPAIVTGCDDDGWRLRVAGWQPYCVAGIYEAELVQINGVVVLLAEPICLQYGLKCTRGRPRLCGARD